MEHVARAVAAHRALAAQYRGFLRAIERGEASALVERARRFERDAAATPSAAAALLHARVAVALAHVLPLHGRDSARYAERALRIVNPLRGDSALPQGTADGVAAEAYLVLCRQSESTARRALFFHRGRAAARRALDCDADDTSAHFALGGFYLHTPAAFGGSIERARHHLGRAVAVDPAHHGARLLLAEALRRSGEQQASEEIVGALRELSPALAALQARGAGGRCATATAERDDDAS